MPTEAHTIKDRKQQGFERKGLAQEGLAMEGLGIVRQG
jgi:hypothetical protein